MCAYLRLFFPLSSALMSLSIARRFADEDAGALSLGSSTLSLDVGGVGGAAAAEAAGAGAGGAGLRRGIWNGEMMVVGSKLQERWREQK